MIFPDFSPIDLSTQKLILKTQQITPPTVSDLVFNNLFGWKDFFHYQMTSCKDFLVVYYLSPNQMIVLPPLLLKNSVSDAEWSENFRKLYQDLGRECAKQNLELIFRYFPDIYIKRLPKEKWIIQEERDFFDYIHERNSLETLPGREFSQKRNLIKQFIRNYPYRYERMENRHIQTVLAFLKKWKPMQSHPKMISFSRYCMACRLVENVSTLSIEGGLLFVDETLVALSLASLIPDFQYEDGKTYPTAVIHVENALTEFKGSYQMINQLFCSHLPKEYKRVNREEDIGLAGLRHAKLSYNPISLLRKHLVKR
ncbi:MAG: DUF2156 domain-containing protein [Candidatus Aureabacteria bacterium]|nr:DUF2156 domain-containing protein [Candidatus Auribacterota bacterium]